MNGDDDKDMMEALNYWSADRFRALQRKVSTATKTINDDLLTRQFSPFLTDEERETLRKATRIMGGIKEKVTHAKEKKARLEREAERHREECRAKRYALLNQYLPEPSTVASQREIFLFVLAASAFPEKHGGMGHYKLPTLSDMREDLKNVSTPSRYPASVLALCNAWRRDLMDFLDESLWRYDEIPDPSFLQSKSDAFREAWTAAAKKEYADIVRLFEDEVASAEFIETSLAPLKNQ